jgi:hypothetical protein
MMLSKYSSNNNPNLEQHKLQFITNYNSCTKQANYSPSSQTTPTSKSTMKNEKENLKIEFIMNAKQTTTPTDASSSSVLLKRKNFNRFILPNNNGYMSDNECSNKFKVNRSHSYHTKK